MPPKTDTAAQADTSANGTSTYTVAKGRTIDGALPGETVELDEKDAKRFLELGFILGPDGSQIVATEGPAVNVVDGVQVKTA